MTDTQHQNLETARAEIMARVFDQLYRAMETRADDGDKQRPTGSGVVQLANTEQD